MKYFEYILGCIFFCAALLIIFNYSKLTKKTLNILEDIHLNEPSFYMTDERPEMVSYGELIALLVNERFYSVEINGVEYSQNDILLSNIENKNYLKICVFDSNKILSKIIFY